MRNFRLVCSAVGILGFLLSCSQKSSPTATAESALVGTWIEQRSVQVNGADSVPTLYDSTHIVIITEDSCVDYHKASPFTSRNAYPYQTLAGGKILVTENGWLDTMKYSFLRGQLLFGAKDTGLHKVDYYDKYDGTIPPSKWSSLPYDDSLEPDNTMQAASTIAVPGTSRVHTITAGDIDYMKFAAIAGSVYTFHTANLPSDSLFGVNLYLYGTDGTTLLTSRTNSSQNLAWTCTKSGTYYIKATAAATSQTGIYTLIATAVLNDIYEPDNTASSASSIAADGTLQSRIITAGDYDYVKFSATAGTAYTIRTTSSISLYMLLYGTDGISSLTSAYGLSPSIIWTCRTSGTYVFSVNGYSSADTGSYLLSMTSAASTGDSYESDDSYALASTIPVDGTVQNHTLTVGDYDYAKFSATAGTTYIIQDSGTTSMYLYLYGTNGTSSINSASGTVPSLTWTCATSGTYYVRVSGYSSTYTGTYSLRVTALVADSYEPDNTPSTARTITANGASQNHTITAGDSDWVKFSATAGTAYTFQASSFTSLYMYLYSTDGTSTITSGSGASPSFTWTCTATGTYYVKVFASSTSNPTGSYTIGLTSVAGDSYEMDNTPSSASTISVNGASQSHTITAGDYDYVKFSATAGTAYIIQDSGATTSMYLYLYGTDGVTTLTFNVGSSPRIVWTCPTSGTYYIEVIGYSSSSSTAYKLSVTSLAADSYEPDNSYYLASTITVDGTSQSHTITAGDSDWVTFTATAGTTYTIRDSGNLSTYLYLYNTTGTSYINYSYGTAPYITWTCATSGNYYIRVSAYSSTNNIGSYTLNVTSLPSDSYEPDNSSSTASTIAANGTPQSHTLTSGDYDWVKFTATAGTTYTIQDSGNTSMYLYLVNTNGTSAVTSTSGTTPYLTWTCTVSGTYYIEVYGYSSSNTGTYTLKVTALTTDSYEPDNAPSQASTIAVNGTPQSHTLTSGDVDWAKFPAMAGTTYTIQASGNTTMYLYLYNTDGATSIYSTSGSAPTYTWTCTTSGTYYIQVSGYNSTNTGSYALSVTALVADSYEPDNSASTASTITANGASQSHTLTSNDYDYVKFSATAGTTYTIQDSGTTTMYLYLYNTDGSSYINYNYGTTPYLTWTCATSGTYYIEVSGYSSSYTGSYSLKVTSN